MRVLDVSAEEADEILKADKAIDRGERVPFDLSPEKEKLAKKFANVDTKQRKKPTVYNLETREKKQNANKRELMEALRRTLCGYDNFEIVNPERQVRFDYGGKTYEVTLTEKRVKKG